MAAKYTLSTYEKAHPVFAAVWRDGDVPLDELIVVWAFTQLRAGYDNPGARTALDACEANMAKLAEDEYAGTYWADRLEAQRAERKSCTEAGLINAKVLREHLKRAGMPRYPLDSRLLGDPDVG